MMGKDNIYNKHFDFVIASMVVIHSLLFDDATSISTLLVEK